MLKKFFLLVISCVFCFSFQKPPHKGVSIKGKVLNSDQEYVLLDYNPRQRGNLNFDNFRSVGTFIDKNGNFNLQIEDITDEASYALYLGSTHQKFTLFQGDDITLTFDINNVNDSFFATGKGAGKLNILRLSQFNITLPVKATNFDSLDDFLASIDTKFTSQLVFLKAIYNKQANASIIQNAENRDFILKIIKETPLTQREYDFFVKRIIFNKFIMIDDYLSAKAVDKPINFEKSMTTLFNATQYKAFNHLNHWSFTYALENILKVEYTYYLQKEENQRITYKNWRSFLHAPEYEAFCLSFLQQNFKPEITDKYHFDIAAWLLTMGIQPTEILDTYIQKQSANKYKKRIDNFQHLLNFALEDEIYDLNNPTKILDADKLSKLIESHSEKPVYFVFWSARFAGASVIKQLPIFNEITNDYKEKIKIVYICIDKQQRKNLWAARIIDNSWNATHYFLPEEGNDTLLKQFNSQPIDQFCFGGASYAFINSEGNIQHGLKSLGNMTKKSIAELFNY